MGSGPGLRNTSIESSDQTSPSWSRCRLTTLAMSGSLQWKATNSVLSVAASFAHVGQAGPFGLPSSRRKRIGSRAFQQASSSRPSTLGAAAGRGTSKAGRCLYIGPFQVVSAVVVRADSTCESTWRYTCQYVFSVR